MKRGHPGMPLTLCGYIRLGLFPCFPGGCFRLQCEQIIEVLAFAFSLVELLARAVKNLCDYVFMLAAVPVGKIDCLGQVILLCLVTFVSCRNVLFLQMMDLLILMMGLCPQIHSLAADPLALDERCVSLGCFLIGAGAEIYGWVPVRSNITDGGDM